MVEGARLESVYAGNRIWGSNPHLSARIAIVKLRGRRSFLLGCGDLL